MTHRRTTLSSSGHHFHNWPWMMLHFTTSIRHYRIAVHHRQLFLKLRYWLLYHNNIMAPSLVYSNRNILGYDIQWQYKIIAFLVIFWMIWGLLHLQFSFILGINHFSDVPMVSLSHCVFSYICVRHTMVLKEDEFHVFVHKYIIKYDVGKLHIHYWYNTHTWLV